MKNLRYLTSLAAVFFSFAFTSNLQAQVQPGTVFEQNRIPRIAVVNFKTCVEKSKMGQKEQAGFETMKKQMEVILEDKERALSDVAAKFNDLDYLDSLSPDAEAKLKSQYRSLSQEYSQQQTQFYQTLSQTNLAVIQKLNDAVTKASGEVAKKNQIDLILNEESCFFSIPTLDVSAMVILSMDEAFEKENKSGTGLKSSNAGLQEIK